MVDLPGCQSHACMIAKPQGQGTNSGKCYCPPGRVRLHIENQRREIARLRATLERLAGPMDRFTNIMTVQRIAQTALEDKE